MSHTKGPWRWLGRDNLVGDHGRRPAVIGASRDEHGNPCMRQQVDGRMVMFDPASADGKLIAAAPDLLAFAKRVRDAAGLTPAEWAVVRHEAAALVSGITGEP